jgi:hypothetical protein
VLYHCTLPYTSLYVLDAEWCIAAALCISIKVMTSAASPLPPQRPEAYAYDTDWNQALMNCELKISTARSGSGSKVKIVTGPLPTHAIG